MLFAAALIALLVWGAVLVLPWQPHRMRERIDAASGPCDLGNVTVLIPARNEARVIERTLAALARQGPGLSVIVVDDESSDSTGSLCKALAEKLSSETRRLGDDVDYPLTIEVLTGQSLPAGWGGKLWALEQGLGRSTRAYTLLLDADIELSRHMIPALLDVAERRGADLVSVMAKLQCETFWEKLLVPAFIAFFKLLYPFALVNRPDSRVAAAAGGCILAKTGALERVGAFASIRGELIDDCSLAARVKGSGGRLWLGVSEFVKSHRSYETIGTFWEMVSRTAYTQLRYSPWLLALTTIGMLVLYAAPLAALIAGPFALRAVAAAALAAQAFVYSPTVRYYGLSVLWVASFPLTGGLFLAMTWTSACSYWLGTRARWKDRSYEAAAR